MERFIVVGDHVGFMVIWEQGKNPVFADTYEQAEKEKNNGKAQDGSLLPPHIARIHKVVLSRRVDNKPKEYW